MPWAIPKLLGQKSQNLSLGQNSSLGQTFLAAQFLSVWYFIEAVATDIDMLLLV